MEIPMAKVAKKRPAAKPARAPRKQRNSEKTPITTIQRQTRSGTKQSTAIDMLRSPNGTNIDALMKVTGWQKAPEAQSGIGSRGWGQDLSGRRRARRALIKDSSR
jgi:hypothetical protein